MLLSEYISFQGNFGEQERRKGNKTIVSQSDFVLNPAAKLASTVWNNEVQFHKSHKAAFHRELLAMYCTAYIQPHRSHLTGFYRLSLRDPARVFYVFLTSHLLNQTTWRSSRRRGKWWQHHFLKKPKPEWSSQLSGKSTIITAKCYTNCIEQHISDGRFMNTFETKEMKEVYPIHQIAEKKQGTWAYWALKQYIRLL